MEKTIRMEKFNNVSHGFNYVFEKELEPNEVVILKMPPISANKRSVNDIGWMCDESVKIYATLSADPENTNMWQEVRQFDDVNKTVSALKIENGNSYSTVIVKAILC